jgi:uncharacterized membrane protein YoaK (UPF0700 family)
MLLLRSSERTRRHHDLFLGLTTAMTAGLVNVCSVMAFFAFSTNVTGHVAIFAEEISKGHWHQVSVVVGWMFSFLFGAFLANALLTMLGSRRHYLGQAAPHVLQMLLLTAVAYYGHRHYRETLSETEALVGVLLFTMGLQNGSVATVSNGVVKTTHLTGLFTDLGMEISMLLQARFRKDSNLRFKFVLHVLILVGYIGGGLLGGTLYLRIGFPTLYVGTMLLGLILLVDLGALLLSLRHARGRPDAAEGSVAGKRVALKS